MISGKLVPNATTVAETMASSMPIRLAISPLLSIYQGVGTDGNQNTAAEDPQHML